VVCHHSAPDARLLHPDPIARHAHLEVTMKIYAHADLDTMRKAVDQIDWGVA
jgi:hypothetical protein